MPSEGSSVVVYKSRELPSIVVIFGGDGESLSNPCGCKDGENIPPYSLQIMIALHDSIIWCLEPFPQPRHLIL